MSPEGLTGAGKSDFKTVDTQDCQVFVGYQAEVSVPIHELLQKAAGVSLQCGS